jgi:hypothetical protein
MIVRPDIFAGKITYIKTGTAEKQHYYYRKGQDQQGGSAQFALFSFQLLTS